MVSSERGLADPPEPVAVALLPLPRFPLHALALCIDTLRVANREALRTLFTWTLLGERGGPVQASCGLEVPVDRCIDEIDFAPVTIVLAAYDPLLACGQPLLEWLKRQDRRGASIGCVDTGALILARAGVSSSAALSVHHSALSGAREEFNRGEFSNRHYLFEARRFSSSSSMWS